MDGLFSELPILFPLRYFPLTVLADGHRMTCIQKGVGAARTVSGAATPGFSEQEHAGAMKCWRVLGMRIRGARDPSTRGRAALNADMLRTSKPSSLVLAPSPLLQPPPPVVRTVYYQFITVFKDDRTIT